MPHLKKKVFSVTAEGIAEEVEVKVEITDDGVFKIKLPKHLIGPITPGHVVVGNALHDCVEQYERLCERYSQWKLASRMVPKIAVAGWLLEPDDITFSASLSFERVLFDEASDTAYRTTADGILSGAFTSIVPYRMIPDVPEVFDKLVALRDSLIVAGKLLDDINRSEDPASYILAIDMAGTKPVDPAPAPVPTDTPQAELPFGDRHPATPQPEDDEL